MHCAMYLRPEQHTAQAQLEGCARRRTSAAGLAMRSRIMLAAADGGFNSELAERLRRAIGTVRRWPNQFAELPLYGLLESRGPAGHG
jgi:hypothetical protein